MNSINENSRALSNLEEAFFVPEELRPDNIEKMLTDNQKSDKMQKKTIAKRIIVSAISVAACIAVAVMGFNYLNNDVKIDITKNQVDTMSDSDETNALSKSEFENTEVLSSYSELKKILEEEKKQISLYHDEDIFCGDYASTAENMGAKSGSTGGEKYSQTYTQVDGIDEADVIKTDGENVYYITKGKLYFAKLDKENISVTKVIKLLSSDFYTDSCLYLLQDVLVAVYTQDNDKGKAKTYVKSYDVSDINNVREISSYCQDGEYNDSRIAYGYLYLVTSYSPRSYYDLNEINRISEVVPSYSCSGAKKYLKSSDIYKPINKEYLDYTVISGLDVKAKDMLVSSKAYMNVSGSLYMNDNSIYLTFAFYDNDAESNKKSSNEEAKMSGDAAVGLKTDIIKFSFSDGKVDLTADKRISGSILDQYSMDDYKGYFRVAVTTQNKRFEDKNKLLVFNSKLEKVGEIDNIAKGESIKSATFEGDRAYVVTYEQTDPLFTFDLSDPNNPKVLSELKALGYSTHLRAYRDDLLIGFGVDADKDGIETGIKLSMYKKNSDGNTSELDSISFGDYNVYFTSGALYDVKELLIDGEKNVIAFSFNKYDNNIDKDIRGFKILSYDDKGFKVEKTIRVDSSYVSFDTARIIYSGDYLYAFSDNTVNVLDLNSYEIINTVELKKN